MIFNMVAGGGGGGSAKIKATSYSVLPASGNENDVAIISSVPVAEVYLGNKPSTPANGDIFFVLGSSNQSHIDLNENFVLYPIGCEQYQNGIWVSVLWYTYHNGAWKTASLYLMQGASYCPDITGGWEDWATSYNDTYTITDTERRTISLDSSNNIVDVAMRSGYGDRTRGWAFRTVNFIDFTNFSNLVLEFSSNNISSNWRLLVSNGTETKGSQCVREITLPNGVNDNTKVQMPIDDISGNYKVAIMHYGGNSESSLLHVRVHNMYLAPTI